MLLQYNPSCEACALLMVTIASMAISDMVTVTGTVTSAVTRTVGTTAPTTTSSSTTAAASSQLALHIGVMRQVCARVVPEEAGRLELKANCLTGHHRKVFCSYNVTHTKGKPHYRVCAWATWSVCCCPLL
jgi:hypothetical protein